MIRGFIKWPCLFVSQYCNLICSPLACILNCFWRPQLIFKDHDFLLHSWVIIYKKNKQKSLSKFNFSFPVNSDCSPTCNQSLQHDWSIDDKPESFHPWPADVQISYYRDNIISYVEPGFLIKQNTKLLLRWVGDFKGTHWRSWWQFNLATLASGNAVHCCEC